MKKTLLIMMIVAIVASLAFISMGSTVFAEDEVVKGFDVRDDYLVEVTSGYFNMANGKIVYSFSITFDKEFFGALPKEGLGSQESVLSFMNSIILASDYKPDVDNNGRIIGTKQFDSATDVYIESNRDGYKNESNDYERNNKLFFSEIISTQKTVFDGIDSAGGSLNMLLDVLGLFELKSEDIALSYHYGTPYKIIGSDAERNYFDVKSKIYVHEFQMNVATSGREIVFIQTTPNVLNWYILAIILTLPIIIISVVLGLISKRKLNKGGQK